MSSDQDHLKETDTEARFEFKKDENSAFETEKGLTALEAHQKWSTEQIG